MTPYEEYIEHRKSLVQRKRRIKLRRQKRKAWRDPDSIAKYLGVSPSMVRTMITLTHEDS